MTDATPATRRPARTRVKICGITTVDDALLAAALGADAIGLVFAPRSPRRVEIAAASAIRAALPPFVDTVALFMDQPADDVRAVLDAVRPGWAQFHGGEDDQTCASFDWPYLKAVAMGGQGEDAAALPARYPRARGFLFDGHARGEAGGSGKTFDWTRIPADFAPPFFVAGGLSPDNVFAAIRASGCWGVDVSSGVEAAPGRKDPERLRRFFAEVGRADGIL